MEYKRYALYYAPPEDAEWARFCTRWLGWDMTEGQVVAPPEMPTLPLDHAEIIRAPRKYGLHATLKPPFRLTNGTTPEGLEKACEELCAHIAPFDLDALQLARLGRFIALRIQGSDTGMRALADTLVRDLDSFRAPPSEEELKRRRGKGLPPAQEANLVQWGYPYVMEEFRFHITLSSSLPRDAIEPVETVLHERLTPLLPQPVPIRDVALVGEADDGKFHMVRRFRLGK
ncbi:DUF1045 domain-containing protein [Heliomarina baculiformis]|uniref:DUF1045 domain-containing protein n=1 Tax=Heliomarina baculiformis TaxID=2872036 RepID=UPI001EE1EE30